MKNLQSISQKLQLKQIPTNPQHLISHYTRIAESFYEVANQLTSADLTFNSQQLLEQCLLYPFPPTQQRGCANGIATWIAALSKLDGIQLMKSNDMLLSYLQKKGFKTIAIEVINSLLSLSKVLPPISFNFLLELAQSIIKMIKSSSEVQVRITLARFLAPLIEEGVCSREALRTDILKYTLKFCSSDKSDLLRYEGIRALVELVKKDVGLKDHFEQMMLTSSKLLLEDRNQYYAVEVLSLLTQRQVEIERQIMHQQQHKREKNVPPLQALSTKEYITKLFSNFNDALSKTSRTSLTLEVWYRCLESHVEKYGCVVARGACEVVINYLVGAEEQQLISITQDGSRICEQLIERLQKPQITEMLDYLFEKIKNLHKIKSNQVFVAKLLMRCIKRASDILGTQFQGEKVQRPNHLIDLVGNTQCLGILECKVTHIRTPINVSCEIEFIELMKSFFLQNPKWQQSVLSVLLNLTTIYTADLGLQQQNLVKTGYLLRGHALCLTELLPLIDTSLHSTPIELAGQLWDTARGLVSGHAAKTGNRSPVQNQEKFDPVSVHNASLKEIGWIIISRLLTISFFTQQQRMKEVLIVLQDSMSYLTAIKQFQNTEEQSIHIQAFGKVPLVILRIITGPIAKYLTDNMHKFLAQQMIAWYQSLLKGQTDKSNALITAKCHAFRTFAAMPAKAFSSHINALVQIMVDDVLIAGSPWDDIEQIPSSIGDFVDAPDELSLALTAVEFFGQIMITAAFTLKNKVNLVKYWATNVQTIISSKDAASKNFRVLPYLLIARRVQELLITLPDNDILKDANLVTALWNIIDSCSHLTGRLVKQLVGHTFAQHLQLKSPHVVAETVLNKMLTSKQQPAAIGQVVASLISMYPQLGTQDTVSLQLQNLFVRFSSQSTLSLEDLTEMIVDVSHQNNPVAFNLVKGSFMFLAFHLMGVHRSTEISERELINMGLLLINFLKASNGEQLPYLLALLGDVKILLSAQHRNLLVQLVFYSQHDTSLDEPLALLQKSNDRLPLAQLIYDIVTANNVPSADRLKSIHLSLNYELKRMPVPGDENSQKSMKCLKKAFLREFLSLHGQAKVHVQIQALQSLILEEFVVEDSVKEADTDGDAPAVQAPKIENHLRTRIFLLKHVQKLFKRLETDDLVSTTPYMFTFLFKAATSPFEEIRDVGFRIFFAFFKVIAPFDENGKRGQPGSLLLLSFAAQIDAVLSETIKREELNTPETNTLNMKLIAKFFRIVLKSDTSLAKKMTNYLAKGLDNNLVLTPSQFYSEKGMTLQMIERIHSIGKILHHVQIKNIIPVQEIFVPKTMALLYQNVTILMQDMFVVLCTGRQQIKAYTGFRFVYSGSRSSYDARIFYKRLPSILTVYLETREVGDTVDRKHTPSDQTLECTMLSFIGFMLTQNTAIESQSKDEQSCTYVNKALQLLLKVIRSFASPIIVDGVLQLLDLLMDMSTNPDLLASIVQIISEICRKAYLIEGSSLVLVDSITCLLSCEISLEDHRILVQSLIGLSKLNQHENPARTLFFLWAYMACEPLQAEITATLNEIKVIQATLNQWDYAMLSLVDRLLESAPGYLHFAVYSVLNSEEYIKRLNTYIDSHLNTILNNLKQQIARDRSVDDLVMGCLVNAFARACETARQAILAGRQPDWQLLIEIVKFVATCYVLATDKRGSFTSTLRILLLFIDPVLAQKPELLQVTQQAIKHMISITDLQLIRDEVVAYPEKLKLMVVGMYQQAAQDAQARAQADAAKKQQEEQGQQGTIKLKLFGQQ